MSKIEKLSIALTPELAAEVREAVREGAFASVSEVVRDALRDWSDKRAQRAASMQRIRELWDEGIASGKPQPARTFAEIKAAALERMAKRA
jgi:antitoxin ParD1/3/4